jgi:hypothetical protein
VIVIHIAGSAFLICVAAVAAAILAVLIDPPKFIDHTRHTVYACVAVFGSGLGILAFLVTGIAWLWMH